MGAVRDCRTERAPRLWVMVAAALSPAAVAATWLATENEDGGGYDALTNSISLLASAASAHRWIMETGILIVATCLMLTGVGLHGVRLPGRILLAAASVGTYGLAVFPTNVHGSGDALHHDFSGAAEFSLMLWPLSVMTRRRAAPGRPAVLGIRASLAAFVWLLGMFAYLAASSRGAVPFPGLAERLTVISDVLWPAVVAAALWIGAWRSRRTQA